MDRYVCIHGHFYQPPRENAWLEFVELQDSAYPYHDWNERISRECYGPNSAARILDESGRIVRIVNNYASISFNFGPTLLSWLEGSDPETYARILEADRASRDRFSGHGSAIAQAYNHMILPLAKRRDKVTQVRWGLRDFERRFGRKAEGMWLPETAADLETLDVLAECGVGFTLLAPDQASRTRPLGNEQWTDVTGGRIDPTMPYRVRTPGGRELSVFFYDGPISRAIAFEGLLNRGEDFAHRLAGAFVDTRPWPQIVNVATDGETYGHHHRHGEMALAYALQYLEDQGLAKVTNYGEYLARRPPTHEVEIRENTSWSCVHGIERWRSGCGCRTGGREAWKQGWRGPLRAALDGLRDRLAGVYEHEARNLLRDPWAARDAYIDVVLDRSEARVESFLREQGSPDPDGARRTRALELLEMQRHLMLMYTSCGWFFNELSGIETVQILQYAARAIELAERLTGQPLEAPFLQQLKEAKSNLPEFGDGQGVYEKLVRPSRAGLQEVAAHYAVSSLFESYPDETRLFCYDAERHGFHALDLGDARARVGRVRLRSQLTLEALDTSFAVLLFGNHNIHGGVRPARDDAAYEALVHAVSEAFGHGDFAEVLRILDAEFGSATYSIGDLFRDERREVLDKILEETQTAVQESYRSLYGQHAALMRYLSTLHTPLPRDFKAIADVVVNADLGECLAEDDPSPDRVRDLLRDADQLAIELDREGLAFTLKQTVDRVAGKLRGDPRDAATLGRLLNLVGLVRSVPFDVDLWWTQNVYWGALRTVSSAEPLSSEGSAERFRELGKVLGFRIE